MKSRWMLGLMAFVGLVGVQPVAAQSPSGGFAGPTDLLGEQAAAQEAGRTAELVATILTARESASQRRFDALLRRSLGDKLSSVPLISLEAFAAAGGLGDIEALVLNSSAARGADQVGGVDLLPQKVGEAAADLAFTPVAPCRIVDTRLSAAGRLVAGVPQGFFVRNAGGFTAQGGSATDCGIASTATSVEMNFVAVDPAGPGDLRAYAFGNTLPNASVLNYSNVSGLNIANGIAQPVCNPAAATCTKDLTVLADVSGADLVIDVVGYFNKIDKTQIRTFTQSKATGFSGNVGIAATCTNFAQANITITAPTAGTVIVRANVGITLGHTTGSQNDLYANIASTATDCGQAYGYRNYWVQTASEPTGTYYHMLPLTNIFTVSAGSNTFYVNASHTQGTGTHSFQFAGVDATFIPN